MTLRCILTLIFFFISCVSAHRYAWFSLPRDNSTAVDVINVLRCMSGNGYPDSATVAIDDANGSLIMFNEEGAMNYTLANRVAGCCYSRYGYGFSFSTLSNYNELYNNLTLVSSLGDAIDPANEVPLFQRNHLYQRIPRNKRIEPSTKKRDMMVFIDKERDNYEQFAKYIENYDY